jgi:hypothetical protein
MRNIRSISIRIRSIVSGLDALLLLMLNIAFGELDESLTSCVDIWVVLITGLVANSILGMWPSCIQEDTFSIFDLFHPSHDELASFVVEKQSLVRFFPSQASSPHCYGYLEEVACHTRFLSQNWMLIVCVPKN